MHRIPLTALALTTLLSTVALAQTPHAAKPTMSERIAAMKAHASGKSSPSAPKMAAPAQASAKSSVQEPRTAKSLACSKSADSKGLHGKPRKSFMEKCKRA